MNSILNSLSRSSSKKSLNEPEEETPTPLSPKNISQTILPEDILYETNSLEDEDIVSSSRDNLNNAGDPNLNNSFQDEITKACNSNLGAILLQIATKLNNLTPKKGEKIDLQQMCNDFNEEQIENLSNLKESFDKSAKKIQGKIMSNKLNFHHIDSKVSPPKKFSPHPTLTSSQKLKDAYLLFPKKRFADTKNSGSIAEFLKKFNLAQEKLNLSKKEFTDLLLQLTTGDAHSKLQMFLDNKESLESIYYRLFVIYDNSPSIEKATQQLMNLKANKSSTIDTLESQILDLAANASRQYKEGSMRKQYVDMQSCQSLIAAMPDKGPFSARKHCNMLYNQISAELQRFPTFSEFTLLLQPYKQQINENIRLYAENSTFQKNNSYSPNNNKTFSNNKSSWRNKKSFQPQVHNINFENNTNRESNFLNNDAHKSNTFSNTNKQPNYPYKNSYSRNPFQNKLYCSLCGNNNHTSSTGCPKMRDSQNKIILVTPSQRYCSKCYSKNNKKLYHPENLCFLKPNNPKPSSNK